MKIQRKHSIYVSKKCYEEKHVDLLLIGEGKKTLCSYKYFTTVMCDYSLHCGRKHFFIIVHMLSLQKKF